MYILDIINTNGTGATLLHITGDDFALLVKEITWYCNRPQLSFEANIINDHKIIYSVMSK